MLQQLQQEHAKEEIKQEPQQQESPLLEPVRHQADRIPVISVEKADGVYKFECVSCR